VSAQATPLYVTYTDPDGNEWPLSDLDVPNGYVCTGIVGLSGAPVTLYTSPLPRGGAVPLQYVPQPRKVLVGLYVEAQGGPTGQNDYLELLDRLSIALYTNRNDIPAPGVLAVQRPDGSMRQISVLCTDGLDQPDASPDTDGVLWTTYALTFEADDPFFEDSADTTLIFAGSAGGGTGILPLLPIDLGSATVIGDVIVTNDGTADAYPVWTVTGPGTPTFTNNTTGRTFGLISALADEQVIRITTKPGAQSAVDLGADTNIWSDLIQSTLRDLWPLVRGDNSLSLSLTGSSDDSSIAMSYRRRWQRA
jgi:hypothetical protein